MNQVLWFKLIKKVLRKFLLNIKITRLSRCECSLHDTRIGRRKDEFSITKRQELNIETKQQ